MILKTEKYEQEQRLLSSDTRQRHLTFKGFFTSQFILVALICSIFGNVLLLVQKRQCTSGDSASASEFAGLVYDTSIVYNTWTEFQDATSRDRAWREFDLTPLEVLLTDSEARDHGIEPSVYRFPWDRDRGVYYLKAFHDLHCLKVIKQALAHPSEERLEHTFHCLDALRQDIMCAANDTPMPVVELPNKIGDGQIVQCRNYDALVQWTREPERFPCYNRTVDTGLSLENRIEAYAYCPEDSPFYSTQQAYFAKWGHAAR